MNPLRRADLTLKEYLLEYECNLRRRADHITAQRMTASLARNALFSHYPQRRMYSRLKLEALWGDRVELTSIEHENYSHIFMSVGGQPPSIYVCKYLLPVPDLEIVPSRQELREWTEYL